MNVLWVGVTVFFFKSYEQPYINVTWLNPHQHHINIFSQATFDRATHNPFYASQVLESITGNSVGVYLVSSATDYNFDLYQVLYNV